MAVSPSAANFFTFVTAHGQFELTAIVFAGAAGLRMGWGLIDTKGQTRLASLRREAGNALPALGASVVLFVLAAFVEGFISASALPYWTKAGVAVFGAVPIIASLTLGGRRRQGEAVVRFEAGESDADDIGVSRVRSQIKARSISIVRSICACKVLDL